MFKELNKDYRYLNNYIMAMEKVLFKDANIAISKAKIFSENLSQEVAKHESLGLLMGMNQSDRLKELDSKTEIDKYALEIFNRIRRIINIASINTGDNTESALVLHRCSYDLTCWFVNRYINRELEMQEYIIPSVKL